MTPDAILEFSSTYGVPDYGVFDQNIYFIVNAYSFNKRLLVKREIGHLEHLNDIFFNLTKANLSMPIVNSSDVTRNLNPVSILETNSNYGWINNYSPPSIVIVNPNSFNIFPTPGNLIDV